MAVRNIALICLLLSCVQSAGAQAAKGLSLRAGFYQGASFTGVAPTPRVRLNGLQFGVDIPVFTIPGTVGQLRFSPTVIFGGITRKGNDNDGTLYRMLATGKFKVPGQQFYAVGGMGLGFSKTRGSTNFKTTTGFIAQAGIGYDLEAVGFGPAPFFEFSYHTGEAPYRGFSFEVGIRF